MKVNWLQVMFIAAVILLTFGIIRFFNTTEKEPENKYLVVHSKGNIRYIKSRRSLKLDKDKGLIYFKSKNLRSGVKDLRLIKE